jgi:DNA helicase-4
MGLFGKRKDKEKIENTYEIFINRCKDLLLKDKYIAYSDYKYLIDNNKDEYNHIIRLKQDNLLEQYARNQKIKSNVFDDFLSLFVSLDKMVENHNDKFLSDKLISDKSYLDTILSSIDKNVILDEEQRRVVLTDDDYCLVIAGAGTGKSTTIAAKVKYLVDKQSIKPEEILVISFTNKAVNEIGQKIKGLGIDGCGVKTFHSIGFDIIAKDSNEKQMPVTEGYMYTVVRDYILDKFKKDNSFASRLLSFFGTYFSMPTDDMSKEEYIEYLAHATLTTLKTDLASGKDKLVTMNNEIVHSYQELQIANYLYLNNVEYVYEPYYPYYMEGSNKIYTPDFLIKQNGKEIYLEHFGLTESGANHRYTQDELARYKKSVKDKIQLHRLHNTKLIYTFSYYKDGSSFIDHLKELLIKNQIELKPSKPMDVLTKIEDISSDKYIYGFVNLVGTFIQNFKINRKSELDFSTMYTETKSVRTKLFLELCKECYLVYQQKLAEEHKIDFEDMINKSIAVLDKNIEFNDFVNYKYIIIDEYQDVSKQRFDLTSQLRKNTNAKIVAVGDDWQSIYAFSGSDITLTTDFSNRVGNEGVKELKISHTYRNSQETIDIAGDFVQKNNKQIKKQLISPKHLKNPVIVATFNDKSLTYKEKQDGVDNPEKRMYKTLYSLIERISNEYKEQLVRILLIGRYNFDGDKINRSDFFIYDNKRRDNNVFIKSGEFKNASITFLTAHSSKGLTYDEVIILNCKNAVFGFPSKREDDPVLKLVRSPKDEQIEYAEERRLFYVALTRTKNHVYLVTPENKPSLFILELVNNYKNVIVEGNIVKDIVPEEQKLRCPNCGYPLQVKKNNFLNKTLKSATLYVCTNEPEVCGFISNDIKRGTIMSIEKCDKCIDGFLVVRGEGMLGCTNYDSKSKTGCDRVKFLREYKK